MKLLVIVVQCVCLAAIEAGASKPWHNGLRKDKVEVEVLYETECPYSKRFLLEQLVPAAALAPHMRLRLVPFGNANILSNGTVVCQHGPRECVGNGLHACAAHTLSDVALLIRFLACLTADTGDHFATLNRCSRQERVDGAALRSCYARQGGALTLAAAAATRRRRSRYVPWVLLDGARTQLAEKHLANEICKRLWPKPYACHYF